MNAKLYVGNLAPDIGERELRDLFSRTGAVAGVQLMLDPATQRSRGFAFVTMATPALAGTALKEMHCYSLGGRHITVTEARPPQEPQGLMSEGFKLGNASPFRPEGQRKPARGRSGGYARKRARGR